MGSYAVDPLDRQQQEREHHDRDEYGYGVHGNHLGYPRVTVS
jgi:hypothetical protein